MSTIKKKRYSKKNKSAWRKTDIKDVEQFLDEQRQEERIGSFADKKDEELFVVDTQAEKTKAVGLSVKQKRKRNALKPLKSLTMLINTSKVQDPVGKRNIVKYKQAKRNLEAEVLNPINARHHQANKDRERYYEQVEKKLKGNRQQCKTAKDIWAEEDFRDKIPGLKDEKGWISRELSLYISKNIGKPVVKIHGSLRDRTTKAQNFEKPHPGMSYNPSFADHQNLINQVVTREENIIKENKHLQRVTTRMFSKVTPEERDRLRLNEMIGEKDDVDDEDPAKNDNIEIDEKDVVGENAIGAPTKNKKRTKQARRNEQIQKELKKKQSEKKALKKQIADITRIKSIKAEIQIEEEELNKQKKHRKDVAFKKKFQPKRLSRHKYQEPDIDVNMAEDIVGNLRNVKVESNLLVDRFKSFQKRNLLPVGVVAGKRKTSKIKRFVRNSHKEPGVTHRMLREQKKAKQPDKLKIIQ